jgi:hypothetical protein
VYNNASTRLDLFDRGTLISNRGRPTSKGELVTDLCQDPLKCSSSVNIGSCSLGDGRFVMMYVGYFGVMLVKFSQVW